MRFLCWIGFHKWGAWSAPFLSGSYGRLALGFPPTIPARQRKCLRCGREEVHPC